MHGVHKMQEAFRKGTAIYQKCPKTPKTMLLSLLVDVKKKAFLSDTGLQRRERMSVVLLDPEGGRGF